MSLLVRKDACKKLVPSKSHVKIKLCMLIAHFELWLRSFFLAACRKPLVRSSACFITRPSTTTATAVDVSFVKAPLNYQALCGCCGPAIEDSALLPRSGLGARRTRQQARVEPRGAGRAQFRHDGRTAERRLSWASPEPAFRLRCLVVLVIGLWGF